MAGSIIPATPAATVLEEQRLGYNGTTLTEFDSTAEPQIIGNFEVAGSLASFASAESITGWAGLSNGTVYVKTVPNTGAGTITAEFTSTAPTWDDTKMGWYGTGANANHRYLYRITKDGASSYENKQRLNNSGDSIEIESTNIAIAPFNAGEQLITSVDDEFARTNSPPSPTKEREIIAANDGTVRIKFDMRSESAVGFASNARIYINGVAAGTTRTDLTGSYVTFSEDLSVNAGDRIQLYIWNTTTTVGTYTRNFRVYCDKTYTGLAKAILQSMGRGMPNFYD